MFLRLTFTCFVLCVLNQVNSTPTFGTDGNGSLLGSILRKKADFFDGIKNHLFSGFHPQNSGHDGRTNVNLYAGSMAGPAVTPTPHYSGAGLNVQVGGSIGTSFARAPGYGGVGLNSNYGGFVAPAGNPAPNYGGVGLNLNYGGSVAPAGNPAPNYGGTGLNVQIGGSVAPASTVAVASTAVELLTAIIYQRYLDPSVVQSLSYVNGQPEYLFQYVNERGQIILITQQLAAQLVPNYST